MKDNIYNEVLDIVKQYNGIIVGSFAINIFNPSKKYNDLDILHNNPSMLADIITYKLNKQHNNRFKTDKSYNAFKIYDNK